MEINVIEKRRGMMDEGLAKKHEAFLGHPITKEEMRLVPYIQYCAVNQQQCDRSRMDAPR